MSKYHRISSAVRPAGFSKVAVHQVVHRLQDIKDGLQDPGYGENILVEWSLSKLIDFINAEQWGMADDIIGIFPTFMKPSSRAIFDKLVEMRHEFEKTGVHEIIIDSFGSLAPGDIVPTPSA